MGKNISIYLQNKIIPQTAAPSFGILELVVEKKR